MTVLLLVLSLKLSERLVRFTHYLVFKDRLFAFWCYEQNSIIPNSAHLSTRGDFFFIYSAFARINKPADGACLPEDFKTKCREKKSSPLIIMDSIYGERFRG